VQALTDKIVHMGMDMEVKMFNLLPVIDFNLLELLPDGQMPDPTDNYYYYLGSLTQPNSSFDLTSDCIQNVQWINYEKTIPISATELSTLRAFLSAVNEEMEMSNPAHMYTCTSNFRPIHALNPIARKCSSND
jgi:hypothetical protein